MRCVILNDYQGVALSFADWSSLADVQVCALADHLEDEDDLVEALDGVDILVVMRERTPITRGLLDRLPTLRLLVTSGMRNASIDLVACGQRGITVCGTASSPTPPVELTWALILGLVSTWCPRPGRSAPAAGRPPSAPIWPAARSGWLVSAGSAPRWRRWAVRSGCT